MIVPGVARLARWGIAGAPDSPPTGMFSHSGISIHMKVSLWFRVATPDCFNALSTQC